MIDLKEIKNKIITKNNLYCLCIISIIFFLDRYTKLFILNNFTENSYYLNNYMNFDLVWNTGIGFGLFSSEDQIFYNIFTTIIVIINLVILYIALIETKIKSFFLMIRRPPRSTQGVSSAASDVYKRQS